MLNHIKDEVFFSFLFCHVNIEHSPVLCIDMEWQHPALEVKQIA